MAIQLPQGFKIGSVEPIDSRIVLTKAEMLSMKDNIMPEKYFAICKDDDKVYLYSKSNSVDSVTGKFRVYGMSEEDLSIKLPAALRSALENQEELNSGLSVDQDGNIKVNVNEEHLSIINNVIDLDVALIQAIE